jgi:hypothetical protein
MHSLAYCVAAIRTIGIIARGIVTLSTGLTARGDV